MKKVLLPIMTLAVFASCSPGLGNHYIYSYRLTGKNLVNDTTYEDGSIKAKVAVKPHAVDLRIDNKTNEPFKILWDESVLVIDNECQAVAHGNIKAIDITRSQVPTVILPGTYLKDIAIPTNNVVWVDGTATKYSVTAGGWQLGEILPIWDLNNKARRERILSMVGKQLKLLLPISQNGKTEYYTFPIEVTDVKKKVVTMATKK